MSKAKDAATIVGAGLGILVWIGLVLVSLSLPVLAAVYLWRHI